MKTPLTYDEIREAAMALKEEQRTMLAEDLYESVEEREITAEEGAEWRRRLEELESGKVRGIPIEEAMENIRARLKANAQNRTTPRG